MNPRATFDTQLQRLLDDLLVMGSMTDAAIGDGFRSLKNRDQSLASLVVKADENVNQLRYKIENVCLDLIARQQPNAGDLRLIVACMNIALELERMADHAASIAGRVLHMEGNTWQTPFGLMDRMVTLVRQMLRRSLDALVNKDAEAALAVAAEDRAVDSLYEQLFLDVVEVLAERQQAATDATYLLFCAHNLERIGDRITNICERVVFVATGSLQDVDGEENEQTTVAPA